MKAELPSVNFQHSQGRTFSNSDVGFVSYKAWRSLLENDNHRVNTSKNTADFRDYMAKLRYHAKGLSFSE